MQDIQYQLNVKTWQNIRETLGNEHISWYKDVPQIPKYTKHALDSHFLYTPF